MFEFLISSVNFSRAIFSPVKASTQCWKRLQRRNFLESECRHCRRNFVVVGETPGREFIPPNFPLPCCYPCSLTPVLQKSSNVYLMQLRFCLYSPKRCFWTLSCGFRNLFREVISISIDRPGYCFDGRENEQSFARPSNRWSSDVAHIFVGAYY